MSKLRKQIVFVHLLNDYSGSPLVLSQVMNNVDDAAYEKILFTSRNGTDGFLSGLPNVKTNYFWYRWQANPWLRLFTFMLSQAILFFKLLAFWRKDVIIYVNTLLPFGAGLAGKLMGKKVIYHVHETSMKPALLKRFLRLVANHTATSVIHVSKYLAQHEHFSKPENSVIYNTLSPSFIEQAVHYKTTATTPAVFTVLMLCSLKDYKGVDEFSSLAHRLPAVNFELVLNTSRQEADAWFAKQLVPANLVIHPVQKNVHPFYQRASLLLNLSHPDKWIETFGMTVLEGMYYKLPVIVPPVGGIAELVDDGSNGYLADCRNLPTIIEYIRLLSFNTTLYRSMSDAAYKKSLLFTGPLFKQQINACIYNTARPAAAASPDLAQPYKSISI